MVRLAASSLYWAAVLPAACSRPGEHGEHLIQEELRYPRPAQDDRGPLNSGHHPRPLRARLRPNQQCRLPYRVRHLSATLSRDSRRISASCPWIWIGGRLTAPPLPHHLAYRSRTAAVPRVELQRAHRVEADRESRKRDCAVPFEPPDVLTFARTPSANRQRPQPGTLGQLCDAVP